ncbi:MAG: hypothetical protein ABI304_02890, partial [Rudaea sp.]
EFVRKLKHQNVRLRVFAFEPEYHDGRDAALAQSIRTFHLNNPTFSIIALMGNIHASQTPFQVGGKQIVTTGTLLKDLNPTSVFIAYVKGTVWVCMPDCGIHEVRSEWGASEKAGFVDEAPWPGYSKSYVLSSITASPPAVDALPN